MAKIPAHYVPDPAGRAGHFLNPDDGEVYSFGTDRNGKPIGDLDPQGDAASGDASARIAAQDELIEKQSTQLDQMTKRLAVLERRGELAATNKAGLTTLAETEKIELPDNATVPQIIDAILKHEGLL